MAQRSNELKTTALDQYTNILNQLNTAALTPPNPDRGTHSGIDPSHLSDQIAAVTSLRTLAASDHTTPSIAGIGIRILAIIITPVAISTVQTITGIG